MTSTYFYKFGRRESGRLVTREGDYEIFFSRNPYGSHNLVLVDADTEDALSMGNGPVLGAVAAWCTRRTYRRVRKFLAARGIGLDWYLVGE